MNTSTIGSQPMKPTAAPMPGAAPAPAAAPRGAGGRMSLDNTRDGIISSPMRLLIYGGEKVGKSTFASGAPSPLWIGADGGTDHLDIRRMPQPETFKEVLEALHEVAVRGRAKGVETLVMDPLNWFEPLVVADVVGDSGKSLAQWDGGYGRGADAAMDRWRLIRDGLERVWQAGIHIILCAHSAVKRFEDPEGPGYERWELAMSKGPAGLFKQWVDAVLFARPDTFGRIDSATKKIKASGTDLRTLYTELSPAFDAGNRWRLPRELPLAWSAFIDAKEHGERQVKALRAQIERDLRVINDPEVERKVRGYLADPKTDIAEVANVLAAKVAARDAETTANDSSNDNDTANEGK